MDGGEKNNIDCNYYRVYGWMTTKLKLKRTVKDVFAIIYHYTTGENTKGYFNGSISYLRKWTLAPNDNTVVNALRKLLDSNLIILVQNNSADKKSNVYKANINVISSLTSTKSIEAENLTSTKSVEQSYEKRRSTSTKSVDNKKYTINNNKDIYAQSEIDVSVSYDFKKDDSSITEKETNGKVSMDKPKKKPLLSKKQENLFEQFWEVYPKKDDITPAKKAWNKIKPDNETFDQILYGAKIYAKEKEHTDYQFIKKASNWLKDETWKNYDINKKAAGNNLPPEDEPSKKPYYQEPYATF